MERLYFQPLPGKKYLNRNGTTYFCLQEGEKLCSALFISVTSGWTLLANECSLNNDGTIDWISSEERGFKNVQKTIEEYGFDSRLVSAQSNQEGDQS